MKKLFSTLSVIAVAVSSINLYAQDIKPAIVFDHGGKNDKSFNEGTNKGAMRFAEDNNIELRDFVVTNDAQFEQAHRRFAQKGFNPVLGVGFLQAQAIGAVAKEFTDTNFGIIDAVVDAPNVRSILFKEQEGSFLVGVLAAMKSETGKIGFIGGMDVPLIRAFACGYEQGAKAYNPDIELIVNMAGTAPTAWNDPVKGAELAAVQIDKGADIIYTAAGNTGTGALQQIADLDKLAIGVDSNQNYLFPGNILTSMVKDVNGAAYTFFNDAKEGKLSGGIQQLGLKEKGVYWSLDEYNKDLISDEMKEMADFAEKLIVDGTIDVHDYRSNVKCEYQPVNLVELKK